MQITISIPQSSVKTPLRSIPIVPIAIGIGSVAARVRFCFKVASKSRVAGLLTPYLKKEE